MRQSPSPLRAAHRHARDPPVPGMTHGRLRQTSVKSPRTFSRLDNGVEFADCHRWRAKVAAQAVRPGLCTLSGMREQVKWGAALTSDREVGR